MSPAALACTFTFHSKLSKWCISSSMLQSPNILDTIQNPAP